MKIFVAIESSENPKTLSTHTLRWAARAGFNMRIFIPDKSQLPSYLQAIEEANHNWYLALPNTVLVVGAEPKDYARQNGFDLLVSLPQDLRKWNPKANHGLNVLQYAADVGKVRTLFSQQPEKTNHTFPNGAEMVRL